jgi:hypothetical protein
MAQWKKVLVSGSNAHVTSVTSSVLTNDNLVIAGAGGALESSGLTYTSNRLNLTAASVISGSIFSGSFVGNGSGLTGLVSTLTIVDEFAGTGTVALKTQNLTVTGGEGIDTTMSGQTLTISGELASYTNKGVASFTSGSFSVSSGNVSLANSANGAVLSIAGTSNEVDVSRTNGTVTVGLPDDVIVTGDLTIGGDLVVSGDLTYLNVANLAVEDAFVLLRSGSASVGDSGIIFGGSTGVAQSGSALVWDGSYNGNDGRLSVVGNLGSNVTGNVTPSYYVAGVYEGTEANAATNKADHVGNIRVESGNIFIYV